MSEILFVYTEEAKGRKYKEAVDMKYTIPPDYHFLILSVGYYCTVRIFGERTSRKNAADSNHHSLRASFDIEINLKIGAGSCLEEGVGGRGRTGSANINKYGVLTQVESL